ncbi:MAG: protein kinase [Kiritimatiellae bacterium]|nr:protein kinase [Kiritimatiellia bacterium]
MSDPVIPGYDILETIGEGGMGTVYRAHQVSLDRDVAIKILPKKLADDPAYVERFHIEAQAAAKIRHPSIVQVFDAGTCEDSYYFVMEYIDGETTKSRVQRKGRLTEENVLVIAEYVAMALDHAWEVGRIIHRDVKPDNILIDRDGSVKITDLGLAKFVGSARTTITMTPMAMGTPYYCSPEQARGLPDVDFRTDIYALGATMFHLITGSAPFEESTGVTAMARHITEQIPDPMDLNASVSDNFSWLLERMLAKDMYKRHDSWSEALRDIRLVKEGLPPEGPFLEEGESTIGRCARRNRPPKVRAQTRTVRAAASAGRASPPASRVFRLFLAFAGAFALLLLVTHLYMVQFIRAKGRAERRLSRALSEAWRMPESPHDVKGWSDARARIGTLRKDRQNRCISGPIDRAEAEFDRLLAAAVEQNRQKEEQARREQARREKQQQARETAARRRLDEADTLARADPEAYAVLLRRYRSIADDPEFKGTQAAVEAAKAAKRYEKLRKDARDAQNERKERLRARGQQWRLIERRMLGFVRLREYEDACYLILRTLRGWQREDEPDLELKSWQAAKDPIESALRRKDTAAARDLIAAQLSGWDYWEGLDLDQKLRDRIAINEARLKHVYGLFEMIEDNKSNLLGRRYVVADKPRALLAPLREDFQSPEELPPVEELVSFPYQAQVMGGAAWIAYVKRIRAGLVDVAWSVRLAEREGMTSQEFPLRGLPLACLVDMIHAADPENATRNLAVLHIAEGKHRPYIVYLGGLKKTYPGAEFFVDEARQAGEHVDELAAWLEDWAQLEKEDLSGAGAKTEPGGPEGQPPAEPQTATPAADGAPRGQAQAPRADTGLKIVKRDALAFSRISHGPLGRWLQNYPNKLVLFGPDYLVGIDMSQMTVYRFDRGRDRPWDTRIPMEPDSLWVASSVRPILLTHSLSKPGQQYLSVFSAVTGELLPPRVPGVPNCARLALSPDARYAALASGNQKVQVVDVEKQVVKWPKPLAGKAGLDFSSDSTQLLCLGEQRPLQIVDVESQTVRSLDVKAYSAVFIPGTLLIAAAAADFDGNIALLDSRTGEQIDRWRTDLQWRDFSVELAADPLGRFLAVLCIGQNCRFRVYSFEGERLFSAADRDDRPRFALYAKQGIRVSNNGRMLFAQDTLYSVEPPPPKTPESRAPAK